MPCWKLAATGGIVGGVQNICERVGYRKLRTSSMLGRPWASEVGSESQCGTMSMWTDILLAARPRGVGDGRPGVCRAREDLGDGNPSEDLGDGSPSEDLGDGSASDDLGEGMTRDGLGDCSAADDLGDLRAPALGAFVGPWPGDDSARAGCFGDGLEMATDILFFGTGFCRQGV